MKFNKDRMLLRRRELNMNQGELAMELGVARMTIVNFEKGHTVPSLEMITSIAKCLQIPDRELIQNNDHSHDSQKRATA